MKYVSPSGMNICVLVSVILLIVIYVVADWMMKSHAGHPVEVENISIETREDHNDDGEVVEVKNVGISQKNILLTTQSGDD
jgi:Na+-transporting methylmalonyl-CoA/oxaloacetate decarboxylase gamma subunit